MVKQKISKFLTSEGGVVPTLVISTAAIFGIFNGQLSEDYDTKSSAPTEVTQAYKDDLTALRDIRSEYNAYTVELDKTYSQYQQAKRKTEIRNDGRQYYAETPEEFDARRAPYLTANQEASADRKETLVRLRSSADVFNQNLLLDQTITERDFADFQQAYNSYGISARNVTMPKRGAKALRECQVRHTQDVAAADDLMAQQVASCMRSESNPFRFMMILSLLASIAISAGITKTANNSDTLMRWAHEKKLKRGAN